MKLLLLVSVCSLSFSLFAQNTIPKLPAPSQMPKIPDQKNEASHSVPHSLPLVRVGRNLKMDSRIWMFMEKTSRRSCGSGIDCHRSFHNIMCAKDPEPVCSFDDDGGDRSSVVGEDAKKLIQIIEDKNRGHFKPECQIGGICQYPKVSMLKCQDIRLKSTNVMKFALSCKIDVGEIPKPRSIGDDKKEDSNSNGESKTSP